MKVFVNDCSLALVRLSAHMKEHWENLWQKLDTTELDEADELDITVGIQTPDSLSQQHLTH